MMIKQAPPSRQEWTALGELPDAQFDLLAASILVARDEYPELEPDCCKTMLDEHAERIRQDVESAADAQQRLRVLSSYLFDDAGFAGNHDAFYDPRNSYLNEVLERRLGIPLSLAVVQMEVARRLNLPLEGISFPGHFLVRLQVEGGLLVLDPYHRGRSIDVEELRQRASPHLGGIDIDDQQLLQMLAPASNRAIVMRMLCNLKNVYEEQDQLEKAVRCADRLVCLAPSQADVVRDRGILYHRIGHLRAAREDLGRYLAMAPEADDVDSMRELLIGSCSSRPALH